MGCCQMGRFQSLHTSALLREHYDAVSQKKEMKNKPWLRVVSAAPGWEGLQGEKGLSLWRPLDFIALASLLVQNTIFGMFLFFWKPA